MTFIRQDGTQISKTQITERMINYYREQYNQDLTDICDLSTGSELRTFIESIASEIYDLYYQEYVTSKQYFVKTASGYFLDLLGCEFHLQRKQASAAYGTVTFTLSGGSLTTNYVIPKGIIILHRSTGQEYQLSNAVVIPAGTTVGNGTVVAMSVGSAFNAPIEKLTAFKNIAQVRRDLKVTNNTPITGGADAETDELFRERILNSMQNRTFGTVSTYSNSLEDLNEVHDISLINPTKVTNHYVNGERCTSCSRVCYVNATTKPVPNDVLTNCQNYLANEDNRVIGHLFHVEKANLYRIYLKVRAYCNGLTTSDEIYEALKIYFDGGIYRGRSYDGVNIGESVKKRGMISILETMPTVDQVDGIIQMVYRTSGFPADNSNSWVEVSGTDYKTWKDGNGYIYKLYADGTKEQWGERTFYSIDVPVGYVGYLDSLDYPNGSTRTDTVGLDIIKSTAK